MSEKTAKMPEGFQELSVSGQQNWVEKAPGVVVRGILKGRHKRIKGKQYFYRIQLMEGPVMATFNQESVELNRGDIVCVDESKALEVLADKAEDETQTYEVWLHFVEKVANRDDPSKNFWRIEVGARPIDSDEIPF